MNSRSKSLLAGLVVVSALTLSGCAGTLDMRPANIADETIAKNGIVIGSINRIDGIPTYSSYYFHIRSMETGAVTRLRVWLSDYSTHKADDEDGGLLRYIAATDIAPGSYEFFMMSAFATNGYVSETITFTLKSPERIEVEPGKAYYLGAVVPVPKIGENWAGVDEIKRLRFRFMNNIEADAKLARQIYPNLPDVFALETPAGPQFNPVPILQIALALNPDEKFWEPRVWQRIKNLNIERASESDSASQ